MSEGLFSEMDLDPWKAEWQNMPEYIQEDLAPAFQVLVSLASAADLLEFYKLIGQPLDEVPGAGRQTRYIWYPAAERLEFANKRYIDRGY